MFLALSILYLNDRLSGFAMATKTCRAAKLYQRPLKFDEKPICVKIDLRDKRLVPKKCRFISERLNVRQMIVGPILAYA